MSDRPREQDSKKPKARPPGVIGPPEKRRYIRTTTSVSVLLHCKEKDRDAIKEVKATTKNISATGMMVEANEKLPTDKVLDINLNTPASANPIHCKGKVVWSVPLPESGRYHCGVEFTHIEEDNKNSFLKFLCDTIYRTGIAE